MNHHISSFTKLPSEVQEMVGPHLSLHDLAATVRVCRFWRDIFSSCLWRHVDTTTWSAQNRPRQDVFFQCFGSGSLKHNGHLIRSLNLTFNPRRLHLREFLEYAPSILPCLTSAEIECIADDAIIADFIGRGSRTGWKTLSLYGIQYDFHFGQKSTEALLKHAGTLEHLRLSPASGLPSKDIQRLLCSAPNLKKLDLLSDVRLLGQKDGRLEAKDVIQSSWVCKSLEVFRCEIGGIPRPDIIRIINGKPASDYIVVGTHQESVDLQRQVYTQLGQLTQLRVLRMGAMLWDLRSPWEMVFDELEEYRCQRLFDCLAMSLESGLDLLQGLKKLQVVGLKNMETGIYNGDERAWVRKHWPLVETFEAESSSESLTSGH